MKHVNNESASFTESYALDFDMLSRTQLRYSQYYPTPGICSFIKQYGQFNVIPSKSELHIIML